MKEVENPMYPVTSPVGPKLMRLVLSGVLLATANAFAEPNPNPLELVRLASGEVSAASSLSVHVEKRFDVVLNDGAKVEYSGALDVLVKRAQGFFIDYGDDLGAKRVWYDGGKLTLLDTLKNLYVTSPVEGGVAEALIRMADEHEVELPLAPLLKDNLLEELESVGRASYLGIHDAEGDPCHHLLFEGEHIDLQVWITAEGMPLYRKIVATFWDIETAPQQSLTFSEWNLEAEIDPELFKAQLPEGATAIEFLPEGGE
jgi:hypothetical protein